MDTEAAITKVLQNFSAEILKIFGVALVEALGQVGTASGVVATVKSAASTPRKPGRPRKVTVEAAKTPKARTTTKPAKASQGRKTEAKSSPAEVTRLEERILGLFRKANDSFAVSEMRTSLGVRLSDEGRFDYALGKLKASGEVKQHGERRFARYSLGKLKVAKVPRKAGRPKRAGPAAVSEATIEGGSA